MDRFVAVSRIPEKFDPMIMAIEYSGVDITTDTIKSKLLDIRTGGTQSGGALFNQTFKPKRAGGGTTNKFGKKETPYFLL